MNKWKYIEILLNDHWKNSKKMIREKYLSQYKKNIKINSWMNFWSFLKIKRMINIISNKTNTDEIKMTLQTNFCP